jgi:D-glycero-alpha-D-manno-heptose-7-phosphate kinase
MIISRAPFRITFLGGGSDIPEHFLKYGGSCLNTTINYFGYATVQHFHSRLFDHSFRIAYRKMERPKAACDIENPLIRACLQSLDIVKDIELHHMADLPARTGLGSSSTLAVALLHALHAYKGEFVSADELAQEAIHIEREILAEAGGYQDQIAAAHGGTSLMQFYRDGSFAVNKLPLSPQRLQYINQSILMVYTRKQRNSFEILHENREDRSKNHPSIQRLAGLAEKAADLLCSDTSLEEFGELLHEGWLLKNNVSNVSLPEIDSLYDFARSVGIWGGKLMGAGKGGFLMLMGPPEAQQKVREQMGDENCIGCKINQVGSQIVFPTRVIEPAIFGYDFDYHHRQERRLRGAF